MQNKGQKSNLGNVGTILFWGIYVLVGVAAWWHTYQIFAVNDPPFIAGASALAVEGVLAFTLYLIGRTMGDQRKTGMIGVMLFALISALASLHGDLQTPCSVISDSCTRFPHREHHRI